MYDIHKYKYLNSYLKKCKVIYLFLNAALTILEMRKEHTFTITVLNACV